MKREVVKQIHYPIWGKYCLHIIITEDIVASFDSRTEWFSHKYQDVEPLGLFCASTKGYDGFIFIKPKSSLGTVTHECVHFIIDMLDHVGVSLDEGSEEVYSYHIGDIVPRVWRFLKKNKKEFKKKKK